MAITDERRKELILLFRQAEEVNEGRYLTPTAIRDILAMLREDALDEIAQIGQEIEAEPSSNPLQFTFRPYAPPQPETLADVPDWCVITSDDGLLYFRKGEDVWLLGRDNPFDIKPLYNDMREIKITRVLGYLVGG